MYFLSLSLKHTHIQELRGQGWSPAFKVKARTPPIGPEGMVGQLVDGLASGRSCAPCTLSLSLLTPALFFFIMIFMVLIYFGCAESSLLQLLSSRGERGLPSSCSARVSHCGAFSGCRAWALGSVGPVAVAPGLQSTGSVVAIHRLNCHPSSLPGRGL